MQIANSVHVSFSKVAIFANKYHGSQNIENIFAKKCCIVMAVVAIVVPLILHRNHPTQERIATIASGSSTDFLFYTYLFIILFSNILLKQVVTGNCEG